MLVLVVIKTALSYDLASLENPGRFRGRYGGLSISKGALTIPVLLTITNRFLFISGVRDYCIKFKGRPT